MLPFFRRIAIRALAALALFMIFDLTAQKSAASVGMCANSCYYGTCWGQIDEGKFCMETIHGCILMSTSACR
ncbi:MAG: hypothetical protein WHT08_09265 [Bryobacteraceae bacterium]|jgi:predicted N-acyltransferase